EPCYETDDELTAGRVFVMCARLNSGHLWPPSSFHRVASSSLRQRSLPRGFGRRHLFGSTCGGLVPCSPRFVRNPIMRLQSIDTRRSGSMVRRFTQRVVAALAMAFLAISACAQNYPTRPVRLIV